MGSMPDLAYAAARTVAPAIHAHLAHHLRIAVEREEPSRVRSVPLARMTISVLAMRAAYGWRNRTAQVAAASTNP